MFVWALQASTKYSQASCIVLVSSQTPDSKGWVAAWLLGVQGITLTALCKRAIQSRSQLWRAQVAGIIRWSQAAYHGGSCW